MDHHQTSGEIHILIAPKDNDEEASELNRASMQFSRVLRNGSRAGPGGFEMTVKLAPAFYNRELTGVWLKVVKHTEEALEEAGLEDYDVLVSSLPIVKKSNARAKRKIEDWEEEIDFDDDVDVHARLRGQQFEVRLNPDMAIRDPKVFAEVHIVGALDEFVYPIDFSEDELWDSDFEEE